MKLNLDPVSVTKTIGNLRQFDKNIQAKGWQAMREAGFMIERDAKDNAPVKTGRLASSIRTNYSKSNFSVENWTNVEYAPFVEFGTGTKVSIPAGYQEFAAQFMRGPGVNRVAKPFIIPAFELHGNRFLRFMDVIIERETRR
jgi:HK97 gp10 family phage protein